MFELLFGVDTLLRGQGRRHDFRLVFVSPAPEPGKRLGDRAVREILKEMDKRGVEPFLGQKISGFQPRRVVTEGGTIDADMIAFISGMTDSDWATDSGLALSEGGLFQADGLCRTEGAERVYVVGDCGSHPGPAWMAHQADLHAEAAAENLAAELQGARPPHGSSRPSLSASWTPWTRAS